MIATRFELVGLIHRMTPKKVLIFVVSYHAANFIQSVLERIPEEVWENDLYEVEVLVIDDESPDDTFYRAIDYQRAYLHKAITVLHNPKNQGYGGNQKLGYYYAIKHAFDAVVLLHGDGQYPPEHIHQMVMPLLNDEADAVFGSRMINKTDALKGGMPLYKWIGNQILTRAQNRILGTNLSEFHSGYRAYRVKALEAIPFGYNSNYFDFDTDIIIQLLDTGRRIVEIPIPTFYGDEVSRVNGLRYAMLIISTSLRSRLVPFGIFYDPRFDYVAEGMQYTPKLDFPSSHQFALDHTKPESTVLDLGCGPGFMTEALSTRGMKVISVDLHIHPQAEHYSVKTIEANLETYDFSDEFEKIDTILILDIIEHLRNPEDLLFKVRERFIQDAPTIIITTANIGFFLVRMGLLFGQFNYGKRGILDMDHTRLFTFYSLRRALSNEGYEILEEKGIPAPFPLISSKRIGQVLVFINQLLIRWWPGMFAYQMAFVVKPKPTLDYLLQTAHHSSQQKLESYSK